MLHNMLHRSRLLRKMQAMRLSALLAACLCASHSLCDTFLAHATWSRRLLQLPMVLLLLLLACQVARLALAVTLVA